MSFFYSSSFLSMSLWPILKPWPPQSTNIIKDDLIKKDEMDWACCTYVEEENTYRLLGEVT
jgi:hypothetical protein